jgi:hypothetical protein
MVVDDAAGRGLQRRRQRARRIRQVVVYEAREPFRDVTRDERLEQEKQLVLTFGEVADGWQQRGDVALLLPPHHGGGMLTRRREVAAFRGTLNLHQSLGAATNRADRSTQRGALSSSFSVAAGRARHASASHTRCRDLQFS